MGYELFQHGNLEDQYIHKITRWRFVDTAARMDPSNMFTFRDLHKVAYDAETQEYYVLHKILDGFIPEWKLVSAVEAQGEANTLYKIGTGTALNGPKVGVTLGIKSLSPVANQITITELPDGTVQLGISSSFSIPFANVTGVPAYLPASYVPPLATASTDGTMSAAQFNKLAGIQTGATANSSDYDLRDRATHHGSQTASTISDFAEAAQDVIGGTLVAGPDISITYNDALGTVTITYTGASGGAVNLGYTASPTNGQVTSSAGTSATIPLVDVTNAGLMAPAQNTKLAGLNIGTGASDLVQTSQLNTRIGTSGNLGNLAQQNANAVAITGGTATGLSDLGVDGDITVVGAGRKFSADMSNSTISNRFIFQTSEVNGSTAFEVAPNGTMNSSGIAVSNGSDLGNCYSMRLLCSATEARIGGRVTGSGVDVPTVFRSAAGALQATKSVAGEWMFGSVAPDTSCKLQTTNGIKVGNTANSDPNVFDWCEKKGSFTPRAAGTTSAGTATPIGTPIGKFTRLADRVDFTSTLGWSAHTGTGNLVIEDLPYVSSSTAVNCSLSVDFGGLVVGTGKQLSAIILPGTSRIVLRICDFAGGAVSSLPMDTAVTSLTISGVYFTN